LSRNSTGPQLRVFTHNSSDEKNTPRRIRMLINTGGGDPATGTPEGIHWRMNISNEITYVAADEKRQIIPYIHVKDLQGRVTEYFAKDSTLTKDQVASASRHRMDCVDCHNRPTHIYVPPDLSVDNSLLTRRLDASLPYLKQQAVAALTANYDTTDAAMQGIARSVDSFYETKYPDLAKSRQFDIRNAIDELQRIYRNTTFPEMRLNWQTHPNKHQPFLFQRLLSLPRRPTRECRRKSRHQGLPDLSLRSQSGRRRCQHGGGTEGVLPASHRPRGPDPGQLQREPLRRRQPVTMPFH